MNVDGMIACSRGRSQAINYSLPTLSLVNDSLCYRKMSPHLNKLSHVTLLYIYNDDALCIIDNSIYV